MPQVGEEALIDGKPSRLRLRPFPPDTGRGQGLAVAPPPKSLSPLCAPACRTLLDRSWRERYPRVGVGERTFGLSQSRHRRGRTKRKPPGVAGTDHDVHDLSSRPRSRGFGDRHGRRQRPSPLGWGPWWLASTVAGVLGSNPSEPKKQITTIEPADRTDERPATCNPADPLVS